MKIFKLLLAGLLALVVIAASAGEVRKYDQAAFDTRAAADRPIVVAVHASWCPTCKAQEPIVRDLMNRPAYKQVTTFMLDFDADKAWLKKYKVGMQSTLVAFKGSREVGRSVGDTTSAGIEDLVKKTVN